MTLANALFTLEAAGLIRLATAQPELEYLFRHALVQDAAYASLVKADRRQLHQAIGEALERLYADRAASQELAPLLARHFYEAGNDTRALKYFTLAGDAAARVYANAEAVLHYARALEVARRTPSPPPSRSSPMGEGVEVLQHLYSGRGKALELSALYTEALANYAEMLSAARERADRAMEFAALMARAAIYATPNPEQDPPQAQALLEQALAFAH